MGRTRIAIFYFVWFCAVGIGLPWMPQILTVNGLAPAEVGLVLAVTPACALVSTLWGQLADRTRRHGAVLALLALGGTAGTLGLYWSQSFWPALGCALFGALFGSSISTLADTLTLHATRRAGGSFSRVRVWGSVGFVVASTTFGFAVSAVDRTALLAIAALQGTAAVYTFAAFGKERVEGLAGAPPSFAAMRTLAATPAVRGLLAASCLHWIACAPFHSVYGAHVTAMGFEPRVVGLSTSAAVLSEVAVMVRWPTFAHRLSLPVLLVASFAASGARWVLTAHAGEGLLIALGAVHGLTFAAFYVASVEWMAKHSPDSMRASAQALWVSATFGVGGVVGYLLSGWVWGALGTPRLFELAGAFELVPLALAAWLWRINRGTLRPKPA